LDDSVSNVLPNLKIFDDVALVEAGSSMFQLLHQLGCFTAPVLADDGVNFVTWVLQQALLGKIVVVGHIFHILPCYLLPEFWPTSGAAQV
jgi:hypothetical protein